MKIIRPTLLAAQILTVVLGLAGLTLAQPVPDCCQRVDGNRRISVPNTQTVKLNEVFATLVIDSVRLRDGKWLSYIRALNKAKVDTALFSNAFAFGTGTGSGPFINYAPSDFPDTHTDSLDFPVLKSGDTLKNVFVLQVDPGNGRKEWHVSGIKCKFLAEDNPPFPFSKALGDLNRFLDSLSIAAGGVSGKNGLKLGPVFLPAAGDIGLQITANPDGDFWLVYKLEGSGDCPAGCTQHTETLYRIDAQGNVLILSVRNFFALCWASEIIRRPGTPAPMLPAAGHFTADGRKVEQSPAARPTRARLFKSP